MVKSYCDATFQVVCHRTSDELIWPPLSKNSSPRGCDIRIPTCFTGILGAVRADIARWREILQGFLRSLQIWAARHQIKLKVFKQTARNSTEIQRQGKVDKFKDIPSETTEFFRASVGFGLYGEMKMSVIRATLMAWNVFPWGQFLSDKTLDHISDHYCSTTFPPSLAFC